MHYGAKKGGNYVKFRRRASKFHKPVGNDRKPTGKHTKPFRKLYLMYT